MAMRKERRALGAAGWGHTLCAGVISLIYFFPVLWIILTAFKTHNDALAIPPKWLFTPTLGNFVEVFARAYSKGAAAVDTGFDVFFFNSIFIAGASVLLALIIGTLAAYGFSRYPLRGNDTYLFIILTTRMLPPIVVIIPIFLMFRLTGLSGTYVGIILLYTAFNLPFSIWMIKSFFDELNTVVEDAARMDGANEARIMWSIMLPLVRPAMVIAAIQNVVPIWNDFFFPLIFIQNNNLKTLPQGLTAFMGEFGTDWGVLFSGLTLSALPIIILYIALSRQFINGMTAGAIK